MLGAGLIGPPGGLLAHALLVLPCLCERVSVGVAPPMIIRAGGLPHGGDPVAERLLVCDAPIARKCPGGRGGYPAPHLMRQFLCQWTHSACTVHTHRLTVQ